MADRNAYMRDWWARNPGKRAAEKRRRQSDRVLRPLKPMLWRAKARAKVCGLEFSLSELDFPVLPTHCPVFGMQLSYNNSQQSNNSATLDRINNARGYVKGNVIIVSWRANNLKSDSTIDELRAIVSFYGGV